MQYHPTETFTAEWDSGVFRSRAERVQRTRWVRVASVLAVVLVTVILATIQTSPAREGLISLEGVWKVTEAEPQTDHLFFYLPGVFGQQGFAPDGRLRMTRTVHIDEPVPDLALWIARPRYAAQVYWDGKLVGSSGDPDGTARAENDIIASVPGTKGVHQVDLVVRGDYSKGSVLGGAFVGPLEQVIDVRAFREVGTVGFAMGVAILALLHLGIVFLRTRRMAHLHFGLFALSISGFALLHADFTTAVVADPGVRLRLIRVFEAGLGAFGAGFIALFGLARMRLIDTVIFSAFGLSAVIALVATDGVLYRLETFQDLTLIVAFAAAGTAAWAALRDAVAGSSVLAVALAMLFLGAMNEMLITHGMISGVSWLWSSLLVFVAGLSMALSVQDAAGSERHERLVTGSADPMIIIDKKGKVRQANPATVHLLGHVQPGDRLIKKVVQADRSIAKSHFELATRQTHRAEFRCLRAGRERVVESVGTPLDDNTTVLVIRDVTRRRRAERGLLQAARVETAGILAGGLAHDFNNVLAALLGNVELLKETTEARHHARLTRMERSIERASVLTRRLLTHAGRTSGDPGPTELVPVLRGAEELVQPMIGDRITFQADIPEDLPVVEAIAADIEHVIVNLIVNARDALDGSGAIRLVARPFEVDQITGVVVMIEDNGPGISPQLLERVWTPFFTTKSKSRGTGLGLAVAQQVLSACWGRIWYENNPSGGARFFLALREAQNIPTKVIDGKGAEVLLVEDEHVLLEAMSEAFQGAGYEVTACASGEEARIWLAWHQPDILVTDVVMPGISGIELANACNEQYPEVPVLLVSAFIPDEALKGQGTATWHRLNKPVRAARVVNEVGMLLADDDDRAEPVGNMGSLAPLTGARLGF